MGLTGIVLCATGIALSEIEKTAHSLGFDSHAVSLDLSLKHSKFTQHQQVVYVVIIITNC